MNLLKVKMHELYQIGIVLTNFLISFFAEACEVHDLILEGAVFHAFICIQCIKSG